MKPDTLGVDDMPYKILALKNFCIGQFGYPNFMGEIKGIKPDFEFNDGIDYLGSKMLCLLSLGAVNSSEVI